MIHKNSGESGSKEKGGEELKINYFKNLNNLPSKGFFSLKKLMNGTNH